MKNIKKSFLLLVIISICCGKAFGQVCHPWGSASQNSDTGQLNIAKNRAVEPIPGDAAVSVTLQDLLAKPTGEDKTRFAELEGKYVYTEGYVASIPEEEGPESCNCRKAMKSKKNGDLHIYIGETASAANTQCIIVEFTPKFKTTHPDYASMVAKGKHVRVSGYLIYDFEHEINAVNTCGKCTGKIWRKTCWEIHPVLKLETIK